MSRHGYIDLYFAGGEYWTFYICDFEKYQKIKWKGKEDFLMNEVIKNMAREIAKYWWDENDIPSTKEIEKASEEVYEVYWNDARFNDVRFDLEKKITQEICLRERQGFVTGFEYAVELLSKEEKHERIADF